MVSVLNDQQLTWYSPADYYKQSVGNRDGYFTTPGKRGLLGLIFAGYVALASQSPSPIIGYSVAILLNDFFMSLLFVSANMQAKIQFENVIIQLRVQ